MNIAMPTQPESLRNLKVARGFSLVELSVVLLIIGLIMSAGVKYLTVQFESSAYSATNTKLSTIKVSLQNYLRTYHRLPCPDTKPDGGNVGSFSTTTPPDGIENRDSTNTTPDTSLSCDNASGVVPYQTLGLTRDIALDGWQNFISYRVYYPSSGASNDWTRTSNFSADNVGVITIKDRYPPSSSTPTTISNGAVFVLISHGKNGLGAYTVGGTRNSLPDNTTDEYQNTNSAGDSYKREISIDTSNTTYGTFDDLLVFSTANELLAPLFSEGSIEPVGVEVAKEMENISSKINGYALSNSSCAPPSSLSVFDTSDSLWQDPWGTAYVYNEDIKEIQNDGDAKNNADNHVTESTHIAYSITSAGPDRNISTTSDNIVSSYTAADLIGMMGGSFISNNCP